MGSYRIVHHVGPISEDLWQALSRIASKYRFVHGVTITDVVISVDPEGPFSRNCILLRRDMTSSVHWRDSHNGEYVQRDPLKSVANELMDCLLLHAREVTIEDG